METTFDDVQDGILIIRADGGLNARTADQFVDSLGKMVDAGLRDIIVDCSRLEHISSYGLGVLVRLNQRMKDHAGEVKIASAGGMIVEVLRLTRLNRIFEIYPDVPSARESFKVRKKPPIIFR